MKSISHGFLQQQQDHQLSLKQGHQNLSLDSKMLHVEHLDMKTLQYLTLQDYSMKTD